jgi:hypothetical protein
VEGIRNAKETIYSHLKSSVTGMDLSVVGPIFKGCLERVIKGQAVYGDALIASIVALMTPAKVCVETDLAIFQGVFLFDPLFMERGKVEKGERDDSVNHAGWALLGALVVHYVPAKVCQKAKKKRGDCLDMSGDLLGKPKSIEIGMQMRGRHAAAIVTAGLTPSEQEMAAAVRYIDSAIPL